MTLPEYFNPKKSLQLYGLFDNFDFLVRLYNNENFPNVLMLSGKKGSGKSTLLYHLMFYIFDKDNYNVKKNEYVKKSNFLNHFINDIFSNIIHISGTDYNNSKIEDIRNLKKKITQSSISDKPRFIIFDDIELFNNNSLNALLKIIEEPTYNNYFLLINNNSRPLLDTIKSRCIDIKIILNKLTRQDIISSLIKKFNIDIILDKKTTQLTPGNYLKFNYIFNQNNMSFDEDFIKNLNVLLNLYKKDKNKIFIDMILFLTDNFFKNLKNNNSYTADTIIEHKRYVFENINKFFLFNLNQKTLLNDINNKIYYE
jgi:DNA polymerase III subunit delta'